MPADDAEPEYTVDHRLDDTDENIHTVWNNGLDPILRVSPGDVIRFECRDANDGQINEDTTPDDLREPSGSGHHLTGPVAVEGAAPGDVLEVELLDLDHKGWGYTLFRAGELGYGLLPEDFPDPGLHIWDLDGDVGHFVDGIEVPLDPFPGVVGVAPAEDGEHSTTPPRNVGGNLDVKHMTQGATVYLPVEVDYALFSIGDGHAAQGDGEVCISAIEAPLSITVRLDVRSDMDIEQPEFRTSHPFTPTGTDEPMYATTGISDDLMDATKLAVRHMIDHLSEERGLSRGDAYILCSTAVDLKINEVVDAPNWVVSAYLPESIFP